MLSFIFVKVCDLCELKRIWLFISILPLEIQLSRGVGEAGLRSNYQEGWGGGGGEIQLSRGVGGQIQLSRGVGMRSHY